MAMSESDLDRIAESLGSVGAGVDNPAAGLRERFPGLRFVHLDAEDIEGRPIRSAGCFELYLLDTRDHCPVFTDDLAVAGAVVLTARKERGA